MEGVPLSIDLPFCVVVDCDKILAVCSVCFPRQEAEAIAGSREILGYGASKRKKQTTYKNKIQQIVSRKKHRLMKK